MPNTVGNTALAMLVNSDRDAQEQRFKSYQETLDGKLDSLIGRISAIENKPSEADSVVEASEADDDDDDSQELDIFYPAGCTNDFVSDPIPRPDPPPSPI